MYNPVPSLYLLWLLDKHRREEEEEEKRRKDPNYARHKLAEERREMERDRRFREAVARDEAIQAKRQYQEKLRKEEEKLEEYRRREQLYDDAREKNPWDFSFLPEGWNVFGQRSIFELPWDGSKEEYEKLTKNK